MPMREEEESTGETEGNASGIGTAITPDEWRQVVRDQNELLRAIVGELRACGNILHEIAVKVGR